jgi:hypothetical protein
MALLVGVAMVGAFTLIPTQEITAAEGCWCGSSQTTANVTGVSTVDCAWAEMDAHNQAKALAGCGGTSSFFFCSQSLEVIDDNNCQKFWPSGEFRVVARLHYQCKYCE